MPAIERKIGKPFDIYIENLRKGFIQKRDLDILQVLYKFRFVSFSDLTKLYFNSKKTANARLLKLFRCRLVDRYRYLEGEYIYTLDDVGVHYLAGHLQTTVDELGWRRRDNQAKFPFVHHFLQVMRLYLSLRKQVALTKFEPEYTLKGEGFNFRPDAFAVFYKNNYDYHLFFEVDTGSEWQNKIVEKVKCYEAYYRAKKTGVMPFVVFVTDKEERLMKLRGWVEKARKEKLVFKFWTFELGVKNL